MFEGSNITALAADEAPLHVFGRDIDGHRRRVLRRLRRQALHGREQDAAGFVGDVLFRAVEHLVAQAAGLGLVLFLQVGHGLALSIFRRQPGKPECFPGEEVALAEAVGLEGFGRLSFGLRLCEDPVGLALLILGLGVQFGGFDRRFAAGQFNFIL